jgi:hypothetical protein
MSDENLFSKNSKGDFKPLQQNKKTRKKKSTINGYAKKGGGSTWKGSFLKIPLYVKFCRQFSLK